MVIHVTIKQNIYDMTVRYQLITLITLAFFLRCLSAAFQLVP